MRLRILSRTLAAVAIAVLSTALGGPAPSAQAHPTRTVLTIHWGAEDFPGTLALDAAIREVLQSQAGPPVNYYAEYLETEIFPAEPASLALRDYIREKFEGRRIDLVITNTTPALQFALRHRGELFPDVPIVFVAGPTRELKLDRAAAVTGVVSDVTFAETLDLALKLHPSVQRVFVVAQAPTSPDYAGRVRAVLERFSEHVELTYISEKSVPGLLAAVNAIPAGSLILYTRYQPVEAERVVYTDEIARLMAQVSAVPIYGTTDLYMGSGVVGGMMRSSRTTGTRVGEMVRRILNGTPPENIPIESVRFVPTFDWRQLRRWGIDSSRLPPDSDIQFRTPTTWESYRWYIVGTVIVVAAQLLLIVGLLTQSARRRRAEETIRAREATLRTSYERIRHLAGRLINAQEAARADIARDLHDDVCQRLVYVSMAVNSLKASSGRIQDEEAQEGLSELERDTLGVFDGIRRLSHELHPVSLRLLASLRR
jgi:signal transduction histidine kinase